MPKIEERFYCPVCLGIKMTKLELQENPPITIDCCKRCGGIWFDKGEVGQMRQYRQQALLSRIALKDSVYRAKCHSCHQIMDRNVEKCPSCNHKNTIDCPRCNVEMKAVHYQDLKLDACSNCKGVWFDEIELSEIWNMNLDAISRKKSSGIAIDGLEGALAADLFLDVLFWNPHLLHQGGQAAMEAGGHIIGGLGHLASNAPEVAGQAIEATGELAGSVFEIIAKIIGEILSGLD